jgi:thiol-disulfide isomerase/thioredoxin
LPKDKVFINGTSDDITAFKYLNVMNNTYLFGKSHANVTKEIFSDSLNMILHSISKPLVSEIIAGGKDTFYRGKVFLIPGDTIGIKIENRSMKFFGQNAIQNNFWSKLYEETPDYNKNPYSGSLIQYKNKVRDIYESKVDFLNNYISDNNIQSKLFINAVKTDLRQEYLFMIINPVSTPSPIPNHYYNEIDGLIPLVYREADLNSEIIFDLSKYFEKLSIEEFKDVNALNNSVFLKDNINSYIRYYFLDLEFLPYSKEKFLAEKEFIENNFDGEVRNYAIARMLRDYHLKGFGKSINTIELLKNSIDEYEAKFTHPSYKDYMNKIKEDLNSYDFALSESALNTKFVNSIGDTLTLKTVLSRSTKKIKVIDFWATWCPPCVDQIKKGKAFKDRLSAENNVEWIYISSEKNDQRWLKKNTEFQHILNYNNSFFISNGEKSSLIRSLKVKELPRYVILDKDDRIVLANAPSPSDEETFEQIIDTISHEN